MFLRHHSVLGQRDWCRFWHKKINQVECRRLSVLTALMPFEYTSFTLKFPGHGALHRKCRREIAAGLSAIADNRHNQLSWDMTSVLLDKSVFQRLAEQTAAEQVRAWNHLHALGQIVIPAILVEEVIVNIADPGPLSPALVEEMRKSILRLSPCWMDDIFEVAFQELVEGKPKSLLPQFPPEFVTRILNLAPNNSELQQWVSKRRADREIIVQTRMAAQNELLPRHERREMSGEAEFWERLKSQFLKIVKNPERKGELLEVVFGETFRGRHPDSISRIAEAFQVFNENTFINYYVTLSILMVRLAYMYAPLVQFKETPGASLRRFIGRSAADQRNNATDEQYIVSAMICSRLLTRDEGMKNVFEMFRLNAFTQCQTVYLDPRGEIMDQILKLRI